MALYRCGWGSKITSYTTIVNNVTSASSAHTYTIDKAGLYMLTIAIVRTTTNFDAVKTTGTIVVQSNQASTVYNGIYGLSESLLINCKVGDTITIKAATYGRHSLYLLS